ncbi:hypothetical protein ACEWY4_018141 [Coilia grayii]|uniref:Ig-like domain-containing protein n=1 Tax=Coilia grayii TaxID=363190 RepID=A0ABD1JIT5_9TELE
MFAPSCTHMTGFSLPLHMEGQNHWKLPSTLALRWKMVSHYVFLTLLLISCPHLLGVALGSDSNPGHSQGSPPPPVPSLVQLQSVGGRIVFLCKAPEGHQGLRFELYCNKALCGTVVHRTEECGAIFTVARQDVTRETPFCCLYKDAQDIPSVFSAYVYGKVDEEVSPLPQPILKPSSRQVQSGQRLSLNCSMPVSLCLQPKAFTLFRRSTASNSSLVSHSGNPDFSVAPVDSELYSCQYQISLSTGQRVKSALSPDVQVTVSQTQGPKHQDTPNTAPEQTATDWPLVLGALSAAVLFVVIVIGLGVIVRRKVVEMAKEKKRREDDKFWTTVRARDHIVDLPVQRLSSCFKDTGPGTAEYADPKSLSTFANPTFC